MILTWCWMYSWILFLHLHWSLLIIKNNNSYCRSVPLLLRAPVSLLLWRINFSSILKVLAPFEKFDSEEKENETNFRIIPWRLRKSTLPDHCDIPFYRRLLRPVLHRSIPYRSDSLLFRMPFSIAALSSSVERVAKTIVRLQTII